MPHILTPVRIVITLTASLLIAVSASAGTGKQPNIIIVLTDDQGYGDLSCHGNPVLKTPHLDKLHKESIRLTDFHVSPMCTPTRSQLLTGIDALKNGAMNVSSGRTLLRKDLVTLADVLAAAGYRTGIFGKWHLGDNYPYRPQDRGFHESIWFPSSHISSAPDYWQNDYFDDHYQHNGVVKQFKGYCTDIFFDEAMKWMKEQQARGKPFFAYIPLNSAHGPHYVPDHYRQKYKGQPPNRASFFGMIDNIDENMGKLETMLRESKLRDNTIMIFMTDNGGTAGVPLYNAGMRGQKITLYDGGHRVPCFIRWPDGKLQKPGDLDELTQVQDMMPTLIDLCGLQQPANTQFDGVSLAPLLRGKQNKLPDRMLVVQFSRMNAPVPKKGDAAVLWQKWRLVDNKELYDVSKDPGQKQDIAEKHPEIVAKLRAHYNQWWKGVAPKMNEFSRITIGSDKENPLMLSPADWQDVFLDQVRQVRIGLDRNGSWGLFVEQPGEYEITLRRWPKESGKTIRAALPLFKATDGTYPAGKGLPVAQAKISIGKIESQKPVNDMDQEIVFRVQLEQGEAELRTWFFDDAGQELCGAYYVYVRRKK
jgi:arylsulfatase A-like enzyme